MNITLDTIKAEHSKIAEMIAAFEAQAVTSFVFPESQIELKHGEYYAGLIVGKDGEPSHHLILLPGEKEEINWETAKAWAAEIGGELPTRREQALLYANLKEQFQPQWYWSGEQHASSSGCAWGQGFGVGGQGTSYKYCELRARAVRRIVI